MSASTIEVLFTAFLAMAPVSELRGAILSSEQCEVIARLLGVRVKS